MFIIDNRETLVVNLFAGAGAGKSTMMAEIFSKLKWLGINCEMAPEFAKEAVWENRGKVLKSQVYILGKQLYRLQRLVGEVDVIITDSPILLSSIYKDDSLGDKFDDFVLDLFSSFNTLNYFIIREKAYNPKGRLQNLAEAGELDNKIRKMLETSGIDYITTHGTSKATDTIVNDILRILVEMKGGK